MTIRSIALLRCLERPGPSRLAGRKKACGDCLRFVASEAASTSSKVTLEDTSEASSSSSTPSPSSSSTPSSTSSNHDTLVDSITIDQSTSSTPSFDESLKPGYENWLMKVGRSYKYPKENGSNWLGGNVPFPTNPTFRPPAPLSSQLHRMIYLDSLGYNPNPKSNEQSIGLSVAKLSEKYGVGKKRVEAVVRLMNEEEGWKRDGKILQTPFQTAMEKHLGVRHPRSTTTPHIANIRTEQQERNTRLLHPSVSIEAAGEMAHEAAMNEGGDTIDDSVFTQRDTVGKVPGLERGAWEFKDEVVVAQSFTTSRDEMDAGGDGKAAFANIQYKTPYTLQEGKSDVQSVVAEAEKVAEEHSTNVDVGKSRFRFVDTSGQPHVKTHSTGGQAVKEYQRKKKLEKRRMSERR